MINEEELEKLSLEELQELMENLKKEKEQINEKLKEKRAIIGQIKRYTYWINKKRNHLTYSNAIIQTNLYGDYKIKRLDLADKYDSETQGYIKRYEKVKREMEDL